MSLHSLERQEQEDLAVVIGQMAKEFDDIYQELTHLTMTPIEVPQPEEVTYTYIAMTPI